MSRPITVVHNPWNSGPIGMLSFSRTSLYRGALPRVRYMTRSDNCWYHLDCVPDVSLVASISFPSRIAALCSITEDLLEDLRYLDANMLAGYLRTIPLLPSPYPHSRRSLQRGPPSGTSATVPCPFCELAGRRVIYIGAYYLFAIWERWEHPFTPVPLTRHLAGDGSRGRKASPSSFSILPERNPR